MPLSTHTTAGDVATIVALLPAEIRITMPPEPPCHGIPEAERFFAHILGAEGPGTWKLMPSRANGTHATINTVRPPGADGSYLISIDLLTTADGKITAIHCFIEPTSVAPSPPSPRAGAVALPILRVDS